MKPQIIVICGPTASGKSALAINLAKQIGGEIISADSLAIYKRLDIGTAKPTIEEQSTVKHHLIDVIEPTDSFSVSDYEERAIKIIEELLSKNITPIICGGTGFYINSILYKLSYGKTAGNLEIRQKYLKLAKNSGVDVVYNELLKVDPETANKLHKNDLVRVVRALEIYYSTGVKKSNITDELTPRYSYLAFSPEFERCILYDRINKRVDIMLENGLVNEVNSLILDGIDKTYQCMQGIGYKETYDAIISGDFSGLSELIKLNSRRYAKRQITFFKRLEGLIYVDCNPDISLKQIIDIINRKN